MNLEISSSYLIDAIEFLLSGWVVSLLVACLVSFKAVLWPWDRAS